MLLNELYPVCSRSSRHPEVEPKASKTSDLTKMSGKLKIVFQFTEVFKFTTFLDLFKHV